jgi:hypothetical protein
VRDQGEASSRGCVNDPNHWLACAKERRQGSALNSSPPT